MTSRSGDAGTSVIVLALYLACSALWLPACSGESSSIQEAGGSATIEAERVTATGAENPESTTLVRGHLVIGHEVRSFKPCGSGQDLWVMDETGGELARIYEELTSAVYQELYVEILGQIEARPADGFGADYDGSITAMALRHAAPESHGCGEDLSGVVMRAFGNEPFWRLDIRGEKILLSELGAEDRIFSPYSLEIRDEGLHYFSAASATESGQAANVVLEVAIEERPCRDSMSGAYFSLTARVEVGDRELGGCARQGW